MKIKQYSFFGGKNQGQIFLLYFWFFHILNKSWTKSCPFKFQRQTDFSLLSYAGYPVDQVPDIRTWITRHVENYVNLKKNVYRNSCIRPDIRYPAKPIWSATLLLGLLVVRRGLLFWRPNPASAEPVAGTGHSFKGTGFLRISSIFNSVNSGCSTKISYGTAPWIAWILLL